MGKATFPEEDAGTGGVESSGPALALTAPQAGTFSLAPSFPPFSFPRPGKASKASFLPPGSTSIQGRIIPGGHTMALISRGARRRDQRTPSLTYFLFPPSGSGLGPERPYPDWGQEEGEHPHFPFPPLNHCWTHGSLQREAGVGVCEDLRAKGRGGHDPQTGGGTGGSLESLRSPEIQPQGYINQNEELGNSVALFWIWFFTIVLSQ